MNWCDGFYENSSSLAFSLCLPLAPFVALGIVLIGGVALLWMTRRKHSS
ncbi:QVPTGV class sortase B protein-sorting domain-containing protein [Rhizobium sp. PAMB 3182]